MIYFVCLFVCSELIEELVRATHFEFWHVKCANLEQDKKFKRYLY